MEKRLSAGEKHYRDLFDLSLSPRCLSLPDGSIVEANAAFKKLFYPRTALFSLRDFLGSSSDWKALSDSIGPNRNIQGKELSMKDSNGKDLKILASIADFDDPRYGRLLSCEFFDLTESQRLREELMQSQKMDALGKLAGGIAHDFNNILTTIVGHAEMLRMDLNDKYPGNKDIEGISAGANRASKLTRQLLGFSRKQPLKPKAVDIRQLLRESETMLKKLAGESALVSIQIPREALWVVIDPIQIEQALINLVVNARDSLQGNPNGSIAVFASHKKLTTRLVLGGQELKTGDYVVISVADTGCGIAPKLLDKIFDPFFTTKGLHKGTGLGLAIVKSVIGSGGGAVDVISQVGEGSEFRLWLPLDEAGGSNATREAEELLVPSQDPLLELPKNLSLLVVDDDEDLLGFLAYVATKARARVHTARNGGEALIVAEKKVFDVFIIDINLPGLNGFELYERLAQKIYSSRPACVFISGRMEQKEDNDVELQSAKVQSSTKNMPEGSLYLEKPFTPYQLIGAIKAALGSGKNLPV